MSLLERFNKINNEISCESSIEVSIYKLIIFNK